MIVNWWEIGDTQNLHLDFGLLNLLENLIRKKYKSLNFFGKRLGIGVALYNKIKYKKQGICVGLLKRILNNLGVQFEIINGYPIKIGKYVFVEAKFPIKIKPSLGELLAHAFFDGYADDTILRYSNYDKEIREEFCLCVKNAIKEVEIPVNKPDNFERDIDLPVFMPRFLKSVFSIDTFLGDICRVPPAFIDLVKKENFFGWYFLKAAYLDEGTTSGGEILILTGIKNKSLVEDTQKIAKILGLSTKIRTKEAKKGYYELKLNAESFERFYENISGLFFSKVVKWHLVSDRITKRKIVREHMERIKKEYTKILQACKRKDRLTLHEIRQICKLPESTAYFRVHLLVYNGNLEKKRSGKANEYIFKSMKLSTIPAINEMRRGFGWR